MSFPLQGKFRHFCQIFMTPLKSSSYFVFPFSRYSMLENKTKSTERFQKEKEYSQQEKNIQEEFEVKKGKAKNQMVQGILLKWD